MPPLPRRPLLCHLVLLAVGTAALDNGLRAPDPDVLPLALFEPSTGAMCLDGSMGGYHARKGSKTQLLVSLPVSDAAPLPPI